MTANEMTTFLKSLEVGQKIYIKRHGKDPWYEATTYDYSDHQNLNYYFFGQCSAKANNVVVIKWNDGSTGDFNIESDYTSILSTTNLEYGVRELPGDIFTDMLK